MIVLPVLPMVTMYNAPSTSIGEPKQLLRTFFVKLPSPRSTSTVSPVRMPRSDDPHGSPKVKFALPSIIRTGKIRLPNLLLTSTAIPIPRDRLWKTRGRPAVIYFL